MLPFTGRVRLRPAVPRVRAAEAAPLAQHRPPAELGVRWGARSSSEVPFTVPCKDRAQVLPFEPITGALPGLGLGVPSSRVAPTLPAGRRRRRRQLPSLFTLPDVFSYYPASPKGPLLDFFPIPSQRRPSDHPKQPLSPCWRWLSGGWAGHLQPPGVCSAPQPRFLPALRPA